MIRGRPDTSAAIRSVLQTLESLAFVCQEGPAERPLNSFLIAPQFQLHKPFKIKFVETECYGIRIKKGAAKKEIADIEKKLYAKKEATGFNAKKYNGVLKLKGDPLPIQKKLRDEWERDFS